MKIAQLTYSYKPIIGGADAYADLLCSTFRERGREVVVYQRASENNDPYVVQAPTWQRRFRPRDFWMVPLWLRGRRELATMDVLIGHYPNYCRPAYSHPRLVGLSHGVTWDHAPGTWRSRKKRRMAKEAFERCARYVANDTFFLREMGLDIAPAEQPFEEVVPGRWFIPNCVDTERFRPPDLDGPRPHSIVVPRNLYRNRGVYLAVQAFGEIADDFPAHTLDIVGAESQPDYAAEVRALVERLGIGDRVRFRGSVPWEAMPGVYTGAELCLIPSLCGEGTSLAALEAMACGTATITTDAGGLTDLPAVHCAPTREALAQAMAATLPSCSDVAAEQSRRVRGEFSLDRWKASWAAVVEDW